MSTNVFAVPIFFIIFRETTETSIIVSVLLSFLKQQLGPEHDKAIYRKLRKQVWLGTGIGFLICLIIGGGVIGAFYGLQTDAWSKTEDIWEGTFAIIASIIISIMGVALLRVGKLQDKWRVKLARAIEAKDEPAKGAKRFADRFTSRGFKLWCEKYAMFMLPFITILREGLEAIIFIGGVSLGLPATSIPLATICGLLAGSLVGLVIYKGGNRMPLQIFLIVSTCFLYLVAAGLFTRAIWYFEDNAWAVLIGGDASETGSGPGSYDIRQSVWHVNGANPETNGGGGWGIFNAILGWTNSATYGSVIGYNLYWLVIISGFVSLRFREKNGHWPLMKRWSDKKKSNAAAAAQEGVVTTRKTSVSESSSGDDVNAEKGIVGKTDGGAVSTRPTIEVRTVSGV